MCTVIGQIKLLIAPLSSQLNYSTNALSNYNARCLRHEFKCTQFGIFKNTSEVAPCASQSISLVFLKNRPCLSNSTMHLEMFLISLINVGLYINL